MLTLVCRESGLDCDYIIKGETEDELLENGAEHFRKVHQCKYCGKTLNEKGICTGCDRRPELCICDNNDELLLLVELQQKVKGLIRSS